MTCEPDLTSNVNTSTLLHVSKSDSQCGRPVTLTFHTERASNDSTLFIFSERDP